MAFTGKSLAEGQVANAWGTILGPSGVKAILKSVDLFNNNAASQTVELAITRSGGTRRIIGRAVLEQHETLRYLTEGETLVLSDGDVLEAQTTTASAVDYTITGADEA